MLKVFYLEGIGLKTSKLEEKMSKSIELINKYVPKTEQEKEDIILMNEAEKLFGDILTRDNKFCHLICTF